MAWLSSTTVSATSGPRARCCQGSRCRARLLMSAAVDGSDAARDCAACRNARIAALSPTSALRPSWVATSAGAAPPSSRTVTTSRSIARRSDCGIDCRVACRSRSCRNRSPPSGESSSVSRSARTASSTAEISPIGRRSSISASKPGRKAIGQNGSHLHDPARIGRQPVQSLLHGGGQPPRQLLADDAGPPARDGDPVLFSAAPGSAPSPRRGCRAPCRPD